MSEHNFPDIHSVLQRLRASRLPFNLQLVARIEVLAAAFADDYEGRQISARSLAGLIDYLEASPLLGLSRPHPNANGRLLCRVA